MKLCNYCGSTQADDVKFCPSCGAADFSNRCPQCGTVFNSPFCPQCGIRPDAKQRSCPSCGTRYFSNACPNCGYTAIRRQSGGAAKYQTVDEPPMSRGPVTLPYQPMTQETSPKSRLVALLLLIFLGVFGIHRFYVGKIGTGLLYLFTMGFWGIGWLVDLILILSGKFRDKQNRCLQDW